MRNLRKLTAVVLAVALVLTSMAAAFAATESTTSVVNGDKAAVLKELKLYAGTDDTNPAAGLEAALKVQDSLIWLATEFGYKAEADKLTDEDATKALAKFADAKDVSDYAKKVVAYSAQEGIIAGTKANDGKLYVKPAASVTAARFATFMLQGMGYKLTGSFTEAVAQLKEVENSKISGTEAGDLTRDTAVGMMYGILTAKTESGKTVAENLLAADSSLQSVLSKNNLLPVNGTLAIDSAKAVANNKVLVNLKDSATATAADFAIVKKGSTTALAIKSASLESDKVYILETEALTKGTSYTLTANGASVNFTGISADTTAPKIVKVTAPDTNTFKVEFSDKLDFATATDVANYTWDKSLKTVKAELNGDRNVVTLTTDAAKRNQYYKLSIANVMNSDGKAMTKDSRNIQAIEDRTAPKMLPVDVKNNQMLILKFQDANGMNKAALETLSNYSINDLEIKSATAYKNDDKYDTVVLLTETQTKAKKYTLTAENLTDNSVLANALVKQTRTFPGAPEDKVAPIVENGSSVDAENNNKVVITFKDSNALDVASAEDISNYTITYSKDTLEVISAKVDSTSYPDAYKATKTVTLTTAPQDDKVNYKLEIKGVSDEFGNVIKQVGGKNPSYIFRGSPVDVTPPYVTSVDYINSNKVKLNFLDPLDKATATDPTNYEFDEGIGAPYKAELSDDKKVVTLTTESLVSNKNYTITINGVEDKYGNATANAKAKVTTGSSEFDSSAPSISYIWSANEQEVRIYFDEKVVTWPNQIKVAEVNDARDTITSSEVSLTHKGQIDDGKTHVYVVDSGTLAGKNYVISSTDATPQFADNAGNKVGAYTTSSPTIADRAVFTGNIDKNDTPEVIDIEQVNVKKLKVTFSEAVKLTGTTSTGTTGLTFEKVNDVADDYQTEWYVKSSQKFAVDKKVTIDFSSHAKDFAGVVATDLNGDSTTVFTPYMEDEIKPVIVGVEAVSNRTIEVTYDEDIDTQGGYKVWELKYDNNGKEISDPVSVTFLSKKDNVVTLSSGVKLGVEKNYYLKPSSGALDVAGNREDIKDVRWDFAGSDVVVGDYVKGVAKINANTIKVTSTRNITNVVIRDTDTNTEIASSNLTAFGKDEVEIQLQVPSLESTNYKAEVYYSATAFDTIEFTGHTPDSAILDVAVNGGAIVVSTSDDVGTYNAQLFEVTSGAITATPSAVVSSGIKVGDAVTFTFAGANVAPGATYYVVLYRASDNFIVFAKKYSVPTP